jgi:hypothetical protein
VNLITFVTNNQRSTMMKKLIVVFSLTFISFFASAQVIQSNATGGGQWSDPGTWVGGVVPTSINSTSIIIEAGDVITVDANFTIDQTIVDGSLIIDPGVVLTIVNGTGTDFALNGDLTVEGEFVLGAAATHTGMNETNTFFQAGSIYRHSHTTTEGVIPLATWDIASTVIISGYTTATAGTVNGNWGQSFGNFEWSCAAQTANFSLGGFFTTVNGDLNILATGTTGVLNFVTVGAATIDVVGNFNISGDVRLGLCAASSSATVNIAGDFIENITSISGYVRLVNGGTGGIGTLNITGNFQLLDGVFTETGAGAARGNVNFVGNPGTIHSFFEAGGPATVITQSLAYSVADGNELTVVGESQLAGINTGAGSFLTLGNNSILRLESTDAGGAIQLGGGQAAAGGNIRVTNANRVYNPGSQIIYSGTGAQFMGTGQPTVAGITTIIDNTAGVTQANATTINMLGDLILQTGNLTITNATLSVAGQTDLQGGDILFTSTGTARNLTLNGDLNLGGALSVSSGTANANLVVGGDITGGNVVVFLV